MAHDTPDAPVALRVNSDTISVTVDSIDGDATHVDVYLTRTLPSAEARFLASHELTGDSPFVITDLDPGATYTVEAKAWSAGDESAYSDDSSVTLPRLFVFGHVSPTAVGVTDCEVDIGYQPDAGHQFPSAYIGTGYTQSFDPVSIVSGGVPTARMVIQILEMPDPKIREGDRVCMVIRKQLSAAQYRWTPILYDALVREDDPDYVPGDGGSNRYFDPGYFEAGYFESGYFS